MNLDELIVSLNDDTDELEVDLSDSTPLDVQLETPVTVVTERDYNKLKNKPIHTDTTANWNTQVSLIAEENHLYIYTDYQVVGGANIPGIKIGDGTSYLIDLPFIDGNVTVLNNHINDSSIHITEDERLFWNDKVTCFLSQGQEETLIFTKEKEN